MNPSRPFPVIVVNERDNVRSFTMGYSPPPITTAPRGAWYLPPHGLDPFEWARAVAEVCGAVREPNPLKGAEIHPDGKVTWGWQLPLVPPLSPPPKRYK